LIVMRSIIRLARTFAGLQLVSQRGGPFLPREMTLLGEFDSERECLSLPRLGEHRATVVAGQERKGSKTLSNQRLGDPSRIRQLRGGHHTNPRRRYPAAQPVRPTVRAPKA